MSDTHLGCHSEPAVLGTWASFCSVPSPPNAVSFLRGLLSLSYGANWEASAEPRHLAKNPKNP